MTAPYARGDEVAYLGDDPAGMRVFRDRVEDVIQEGPNRWVVTTARGRSVVDSTGEGDLARIDEDLSGLFAERGDGFLVEPSHPEIEVPEPEIARPSRGTPRDYSDDDFDLPKPPSRDRDEVDRDISRSNIDGPGGFDR